MLGSMHAKARLAAFLLNPTQRLPARSCSSTALELRMPRDEIGSSLRLKPETISRAFPKFQHAGVLVVMQRELRVLDEAGLRYLASDSGC